MMENRQALPGGVGAYLHPGQWGAPSVGARCLRPQARTTCRAQGVGFT